jgi:hypothetical protein
MLITGEMSLKFFRASTDISEASSPNGIRVTNDKLVTEGELHSKLVVVGGNVLSINLSSQTESEARVDPLSDIGADFTTAVDANLSEKF